PCQPTELRPAACPNCQSAIVTRGPARRNRSTCASCRRQFRYPMEGAWRPPQHRMWAIEYHCGRCRPGRKGRFFKAPDKDDLATVHASLALLAKLEPELPIPNVEIPPGDETGRLHRWGYFRYRDMFTGRQLLGLGLLLSRI